MINTGTHDRDLPDGILDSKHAKPRHQGVASQLSELIRALETANNRMAAIENASPDELDAARQEDQERADELPGAGPQRAAPKLGQLLGRSNVVSS